VLGSIAQGLLDLSRGRQALLSIAQPGLGAVLALGALPDSRTIALGLAAAGAGYLAVFSLNDVLDLRSDVEALKAGKGEFGGFDIDTAFDRHPVALGVLRLRLALAWVVGLAIVAVVLAWMLNPWCVAVFGVSVSLEALYCALRARTWAKTFISGIMVGLGGLAGWVAVAPLDARAYAFFAFLAAWEIAGRNLPNDLADLEADSAVGLRTVATTFGPRASSRAIAAGSALTTAIAAVMLVPLAPVNVAWGFLGAVVTMQIPSIELLRSPTPQQAAHYFNRASLLPALVFLMVVLSMAVRGVG
jgi:4-hydroxybenzoate polyprenyltransferase